MDAVFLSASVPHPRPNNDPRWAQNIDPLSYREVIAALVEETAKRNIALVYGGHPSITRFLARLDTRLRTGTIYLYQSAWFREHFPVDNRLVTDRITVTDSVNNDKDQSLFLMRQTMLSGHSFGLGLFMGGMGGLASERELFRDLHPKALLWPLKELGGQTATLFDRYTVDESIHQAEKEAVSPGGQIARVLESLLNKNNLG